jgi:beta-lactamase class A
MRDRNRFSKNARSGKPRGSAGGRRAENPSPRSRDRRGSRVERRAQKSGSGFMGLFGSSSLFGGNQPRSRPSGSPSERRKVRGNRADSSAGSAAQRLIDLQRQPAATGSRRAAAVIPLRRGRRLPGAEAKPRNLINLPKPRTRSGKFFLYGTRLAIFGVGLGVLAGTMLSIWDPATHLTATSNSSTPAAAVQSAANTITLGQEMAQLKAQITTLTSSQKQLKTGLMLLDLDTNAYVDMNAAETFPAASTIKFPILIAFFQDVDAGKIQLSDMLTMKKEEIATEAGAMQYQEVGTKFSAIETATNMMVASDNTATNMLIDRLGGMAALNQRFQSWGIGSTQIKALLPDVQGTNITTPKDLASLMSQVQSGKLVSMKSRDRLLDIMRHIENDTLLPKGLGAGSAIAHKTGTLGILIGDIGLIDTPTGKRYLASVLVQRPRDDAKAEELIQQISRLAYQAFTQPPSATPGLQPRSRIAQPAN